MLEMRAHLANGHARTANARHRMRTEWSEVARILNSDSDGCVKDWKQWAKYWKDKKAGTKRKATYIESARQRTGGGADLDMDELSDLERRILTISGLSSATGDKNPSTPEQENVTRLPAGSGTVSSQSEQKLVQVSPSVVVQERTAKESLPASTVSSDEGARRRILEAKPQLLKRLLLPSQGLSSSPQRRRYVHGTPRGAGVAGVSATARRRLLRRSPSQRRSEMGSLTERFIAIEERRVEAEVAIARSQETLAEGHRIMAEAVAKLTNTVGLVAKQFIEVIQNHRAPSGAP